MHLSRLPKMGRAMFEGYLKEPLPKQFVFSNLIAQLACEGLLQDLPQVFRDMNNRESVRNEVARILHQVSTAMEKTVELLSTLLNLPAPFVSSPGMLYWGSALQQFVYMITEVCAAR